MAQRVGLTVLALTAACAAAAQDGPGYRIIAQETPSRAEDVVQAARGAGAETTMTYATVVTGDLSDNPAITPLETRDRDTTFSFGQAGVFVVLALLLAALAAVIRFGGGGTLWSRAPVAAKPPPPVAAPEGWNLRDLDQQLSPEHLLAQIAAMEDRRAALVRLLHHCLLRAGSESVTRFARADTERQAFQRLPAGWRQHAALSDLLVQAELAHYGGREVDGAAFARLLGAGRAILLGPRHA